MRVYRAPEQVFADATALRHPSRPLQAPDRLRQPDIYTRTTGQALTIRGQFSYLDTAGTGSSKRMVAYRRSPDMLKMHVPVPFRFFPAWQTAPMRFDVPGVFRLGDVDIKHPKAGRYLDGI